MNPTTTGFLTQLLTTFTNIFATGFGVITPRAQAVLGTLAAIEIAFAALFWALRGEDFTAPFLRKLLRIGARQFLPDAWAALAAQAPEAARDDLLLRWLKGGLHGSDAGAALSRAIAWEAWESSVSQRQSAAPRALNEIKFGRHSLFQIPAGDLCAPHVGWRCAANAKCATFSGPLF